MIRSTAVTRKNWHTFSPSTSRQYKYTGPGSPLEADAHFMGMLVRGMLTLMPLSTTLITECFLTIALTLPRRHYALADGTGKGMGSIIRIGVTGGITRAGVRGAVKHAHGLKLKLYTTSLKTAGVA